MPFYLWKYFQRQSILDLQKSANPLNFSSQKFYAHSIQYVTTDHWAYVHILVIFLFMYVTDFTVLKSHYHTILRLMPDEYELTVGKLQNYISFDQICAILSSNNCTIANKIILDCLIEKMSCREELIDLCHQLENITASHDMKIVINEIRLG